MKKASVNYLDVMKHLCPTDKRKVTIAITACPESPDLLSLFDCTSVHSAVVPRGCKLPAIEPARLGRFNHEQTMWELPQQTGSVLLFFGASNQFGVRMLSAAVSRGIFTFIYQGAGGEWVNEKTISLLFRKLCHSLLAKSLECSARLRRASCVVINLGSRIIGNKKYINLLWDANSRLNYNASCTTTPEDFLHAYPSMRGGYQQRSGRVRVVQYIGSLSPGGAERQLCNLVTGLDQDKYDISVLTYNRLDSSHAHYEDLLRNVSIIPHWSGELIPFATKRRILNNHSLLNLLNNLPSLFSIGTMELLGAIIDDPPDILHAWLDQSNICAAIAGLLADVPVIILSTRNVNPNHFPYLANPQYEPWYKMLYSTGRVRFINNSYPGAEDYSRWLGIPLNDIDVVHNGVDFGSISKVAGDKVTEFRDLYKMGPDDRMIAGIFRLSEEKQPLLFIRVCLRVMESLPGVHALIAGVGPLEDEIRQMIRAADQQDHIHLLGRFKDIPLLLSAADILLHTSRFEGTPNAVLEAQWLACPVVATRAGGTIDAVVHESTGLLVDVDDEEALSQGVERLLVNDDMRSHYGQAGPEFIRRQFNLDAMVNHTVDIYTREMADNTTNTHHPGKKGIILEQR